MTIPDNCINCINENAITPTYRADKYGRQSYRSRGAHRSVVGPRTEVDDQRLYCTSQNEHRVVVRERKRWSVAAIALSAD